MKCTGRDVGSVFASSVDLLFSLTLASRMHPRRSRSGSVRLSGLERHVDEERADGDPSDVLFREEEGFSLRPKKPNFYLDENYILFAIGLLSQVEPEKALNIAKKYLKQI